MRAARRTAALLLAPALLAACSPAAGGGDVGGEDVVAASDASAGPDPARATPVLPEGVLGLEADQAFAEQALADVRRALPEDASTSARVYVASSGQPVYFLYAASGRVEDADGTVAAFLDGFAAAPQNAVAGPGVGVTGPDGPARCTPATSAGQDVLVCVAVTATQVLAAVDFRGVDLRQGADDFLEVAREVDG